MRPQRRWRIAGNASWLRRIAGYRLRAIAASNWGRPVSCQPLPALPPRLFTRTSSRPSHASMAARHPSSVARSAATPTPPTSALTRWTSSSVRAAATTRAPAEASALVMASPMPLLAPVTRAVRPLSPRSIGHMLVSRPVTIPPGLAGMLNTGPPVEPVPASSVLVIDHRARPWTVLMMRRPGGADFAPGAYVFPGGSEHAEDRELADPH